MRTRPSRVLPAAVLAAFCALPVSASASVAAVSDPAPVAAPVDHPTYIVTVSRDLDPADVAQLVGATPVHVYRTALHGFAARLSPGQVAALHTLPGIESVERDASASAGTF